MKPLPIYIGYDENESIAWHVFAHSLFHRANSPVALVPLTRWSLPIGPRHELASTDFADTRFLVPWLQEYKGWAVFADCDMLSRIDINDILAYCDDRYAVMVRKHNHVPKEDHKFLGQKQTAYDRKNWSSLMLFNCAHMANRKLTVEYVNETPGLDLHQFSWLESSQIGALPPGWNHLVDVEEHRMSPPLVHYTLGGPYFSEYEHCDFSEEWLETWAHMSYVKQRVT